MARTFIAMLGLLPLVAKAIDFEEIITVADRTESQQSQLLVSSALVTNEMLQIISPDHIEQALSTVAGVNLQRGNGQEYLPAIRSPVLTGAGACGGFVMAEDGIPLRAAGFCNINELFEAHTEVAQRIEVLRGPGTALYGSNAIHGVVNVITPTLLSRDRLEFDIGENDYQRLKLVAGTRNVSVATSLTHDGGYRDQSGIDQQKLSLKHRYQSDTLSIKTGVTAINLNQETAGYISGLDSYKEASLARTNPNPEAYRDAHAARIWSRIAYFLPQAELILTPYMRHTKMNFLQHFLPGDPLEENGQTGAGLLLSYHFSPQQQLNMIVGADAEYTDASLRQAQQAPTQGSDFLRETVPVGKHYDYDVRANVAALFTQLRWTLTDKWTVQAGTRFESTHYDYQNRMLSGRTRDDGSSCGFGGCRYSRPPSGSHRFANWSGDFGFIHQLTASDSLYARYSRAHRAPQATELYRLQRDQQISDLQSENINAFELGIRGIKESFGYTIALYHMKKDNHIYRDSDFFNVSDGATEHQGLELEFNWQISPQLKITLSATHAIHRYLHSRQINGIEISGNDIDSAPRYFGDAQLLWRYSHKTQLQVQWQNMGGYFLEPENIHRYPGHNIFNLRLNHQLSEQFRLSARLQNLTDTAYASRADYTSFSGVRYFPGRPVTLSLGVEWQW